MEPKLDVLQELPKVPARKATFAERQRYWLKMDSIKADVYAASRRDRRLFLLVGLGALVMFYNVGAGARDLITGRGKKDS